MARGRRSTPSRSTPSRASKLSASAASSSKSNNYILPKSRTWIYTTSPPDDDLLDSSSGLGNGGGGGSITSDGYELYLGARVQRPVVRSLPPSYSYFKDDVNNNLGCVPESAVKLDVEGGGEGTVGNGGGEAMDVDNNAAAAALKSEGETPANNNDYDGINEIQPHNVNYTYIPLPAEKPIATTSTLEQSQKPSSTTVSSLSYSKFTAPTHIKDSRHQKFQFSLNYNTHLPSKNVISWVGTNAEIKNKGESGYVCQLPLVGGTVLAYSPSLVNCGTEENSGDVDLLYSNEGAAVSYNEVAENSSGGNSKYIAVNQVEEAEFPTSRMTDDVVLFRVLWDGYSTSTDGSEMTSGYIEDITLPELLSCLINPPSSLTHTQRLAHQKTLITPYNLSSMPTSTTDLTVLPQKLLKLTSQSITKHVHATTCRKQFGLEWRIENDILCNLVTCAVLEIRKEIALKIRYELLVERTRLRVEGGLEKRKKKKKKSGMKGSDDEEVVNEDGNDFGYYYKHPNQYMSSFTPPPALPSDDDEDDSDNEDGEGKSRSKTKLSKDELKQYQMKLSEQVNIAPSKIAERIKVACTMAYDYVQQTGKLVNYYNECDKRKIAEGKEKERMASIVGGRGMGSGRQNIAPPTDGGEVRRSSRARSTVDYTDAGMMMASSANGIGIGIDELDDAMEMKVSSKSLLPRDNVVGGPTALYLLNMLDMMPKEEKKDDENAVKDDDMKDNDDDDNDPFFKPNSCLIIDQLGRKHRYLSPSSIQQSIVRSIEAHQITTPKYLLDEEELNDGHSHVTDLVCTTGDKISDLGQFEPSSFARCRFAPHTFIPETDEEDDHDDADKEDEEDTPEEIEARRLAEEASNQRKIQRRLDKKAAIQKRNAELERAYRARKAFEIWRFRSIHGDGCTIFPTWREFSMKILKDKFNGKVGGSTSSVGDAASSQAATGTTTSQPHPADAWGKTITVSDSSRPVATSSNVATKSSEAAVSSTAAPPVPPAEAATAVPSSTQNDEELARSLAAAAETNGDDLPLAKRRRTTRRAATSGSEPVFYGGHTSFSRDQLLDSLVRILHQTKPGSSSLMDLKKLVFPEIVDTSRGGAPEMKKIRSALGHLVYRLGKVSRLIVDVEKGDGTCLELLKEGPLVKFQTDNVDANDEVGGVDAAATSAPSQLKSEETVSGSTEDQPMEEVKTNDDPLANTGDVSTETTNAGTNVESATADSAALAPRTYDKQGRPEWREDDDELLWLCHQEMGNKWAEMTELHFKERGLMENHVKNRWYSVTFKRFVATKYGPDAHPNSLSASAPVMDEHTKARLSALEGYISNLHHTELSLRKSLMKVIDKGYGNMDSNGTLLQISTTAIATAADEVDGMAGAEDWKHFTNGSGEEVKWNSTSRAHELIGQVLFRPQSSPQRPKPDENAPNNDDSTTLVNSKCHWYRIVSYTPSIKAVEDVTSTNGVGDNPSSAADTAKKDAPQENLIVERRMRFRAVPVAESDIDAMNHRMDIDNDDDDVEYMLLTEGQARAGIEAALLHRTIENKAKKGGASSETLSQATVVPAGPHPFRHRYGSRVTLTPKSKDGENVQGKDILYGIVAGFDIIQDDDGVTKNKLLVLLEEEEEVKPLEEDTTQAEKEKKTRVAFWSTVEGTEGATSISDIVPAAGSSQDRSWTASSLLSYSTYDIDTNEYHQGSEAYDTCLSILTYMKNNNRSAPFLVPVDPVAHSAPGYFDVIKEPMDLSTLEKYLENGKCSKIEYVFENEGDEGITTPVYRMVYGPFFHYMSLIFDNCVEYNGVDSWIAAEAKYLKNLFEKKCNQLVKNAVGASSKSAGRPSRGAQKSMYSEVDSDVDMYQYDSEYDDDEYDGGGRRSRKGKKRRKNAAKKKEDIPSKAIEQPFMVPENAFEFGGGLGSFPNLKVQTNVGKFTFSQDWSCRYMKETKEDNSAEDGKVPTKEESEEAEMLMLMQMQQQENEAATVRRSTRDRHAPTNYADEEVYGVPAVSSTPQAPVTLPGVEYYLVNDDVLQPKKSSTDDKEDSSNVAADSSIIPTTCRSRLGAEGIQETIHEQIYARVYYDHSHNALVLDNGLGQYAEGSFPPYLGRVVPAVSSSSVDGIVWEIREQYLIPALRWVLRGLVRSGHLAEVDGSLSEGMSEDATTRTSFGSGIVVPSHEYYCNETSTPFNVLDEKEILRKRRQDAATGGDSSSEEEVELSEYEQMRAQRVARNAERLRALGLA